MLSHFLGFIANAYIARTLGVDGFGLINYCLAFLTYLLLFNNVGLTTLGTREIARNKHNTKSIGSVVSARLILTFFLYIVFFVFLIFVPGAHLTKKIILLYLLTGIPNALYLEFVFQAREEMEFISAGRVIQYAGYVIAIFVLLKTKTQITVVPFSYLAGYTLATLFLLFFYFRKYRKLEISFLPADFYKILIAALPIGAATIVYQAVMNFPVICLGIFHREADVGLFSAGLKIILFLLIVERILYYLFFPLVSRQAAQQFETLKKSFILFSQIALAITVPITAFGIILAGKIIRLIYGSEFSCAVIIFRILLLYFMIAPLNTIWGYGLVALNQENRFFKVIVIMSLLNLILTTTLGYLFRGIGVAIAIVISELFGTILMKHSINKIVNFSLKKILSYQEIKTILMERLKPPIRTHNLTNTTF